MAWNVTVKDFMLSLVTPFHHLDPPLLFRKCVFERQVLTTDFFAIYILV